MVAEFMDFELENKLELKVFYSVYGDVCIGLVIIWYAINHKTCADQNQSQNMR